MEIINVKFVDYWPEWSIEDFITPILKKYYNVIVSNKPDVVFHSIFNGMKESPTYKCKKVLVLAENWRVNQFNSDYSISFDPQTNTNYRLPLWQMYLLLNPSLKERLFQKRILDDFDRFCAFTVSNPSNTLRNNHFDLLSAYKKVDAYGKVKLNNLGLRKASEGRYWRDAKDEFFLKNSHKFMMVYENSSYPYYCTEKLMDAFLAGSLPIYHGDPKVEEDWNKDAFINVLKTTNWLELVKSMDNDKKLFEEKYLQPVFTDSQKQKHIDNINNFENWLIDIIKK